MSCTRYRVEVDGAWRDWSVSFQAGPAGSENKKCAAAVVLVARDLPVGPSPETHSSNKGTGGFIWLAVAVTRSCFVWAASLASRDWSSVTLPCPPQRINRGQQGALLPGRRYYCCLPIGGCSVVGVYTSVE